MSYGSAMSISAKALAGLAALQLVDAAACAAEHPQITASLDRVECPPAVRKVLPAIKVATGVGLLVGIRNRRIARLTGLGMTGYFVCAVGSHLRVKDTPANTAPAVAMLATSAWVATRA